MMTITELTSKNNPLFKTIRRLASHSRRAPKSIVLAEGIRTLEEASKCGCAMECAIISEDFGKEPREEALLNHWNLLGIKLYRANVNLIKSISGVQSFQGALALINVPTLILDAIPLKPNPLVLVICSIQDPGNLGTLIRTAMAAGVSMVCTTAGSVSARNPKAIRASAGAFFRLPIVEHLPATELMAYLASHQISLLRVDVRGAVPYRDYDFRSPCALLLGNEAQGLSLDDWKGSQSVVIPMASGVESLNVAAAGSIVLFEAFKQRSS
jgi:RNA methyltransferase, TrmH family